MLREIVALLRGVLPAPGALLAIVALALAACGVKGPLKPPPSATATPAASEASATPAASRESAERKP